MYIQNIYLGYTICKSVYPSTLYYKEGKCIHFLPFRYMIVTSILKVYIIEHFY